MSLHARIAMALGWTEAEVQAAPWPALREIVRPISGKLAHEISLEMNGPGLIAQPMRQSEARPARGPGPAPSMPYRWRR